MRLEADGLIVRKSTIPITKVRNEIIATDIRQPRRSILSARGIEPINKPKEPTPVTTEAMVAKFLAGKL